MRVVPLLVPSVRLKERHNHPDIRIYVVGHAISSHSSNVLSCHEVLLSR